MEQSGLIKRQGANLPHWRKDRATYAVTFRLADSLPAEVLQQWRGEREEIVERAKAMGRPMSEHELKRLGELHAERVEQWLDLGHGSCALRDPRIAELVRGALLHFHGTRYDLLAWCIMPNHVHAVARTFPGRDLSMILLSWKGFTGKKARELLDSRGAGEFWQKESYDHMVRDEEDLARQIHYVLGNPGAAGLADWPWVGRVEGGTALPGGELKTPAGSPLPLQSGTALPGGVKQEPGGSPVPRQSGTALPGGVKEEPDGSPVARSREGDEDTGRKPGGTAADDL